MNWQRGLWTERYDEAEGRSRYRALSNEDSFYLQPKLWSGNLRRSSRAQRDYRLYFVGVAGYASQDVFMRK